jgi:hypothetical protein
MRGRPQFTLALIAVALMAPRGAAAAENQCEGHELLSAPRPEGSCRTINEKIHASPDNKLHAVVLPAEIGLNATPDMESRVVIRSVAGDTLNSYNHSSPRGANGYYVDTAQWSPDSQFFVYSLVSSGGHSPWSHPTMVYSVHHNRFTQLSDLIGGRPILSEKFQFSGEHELTASTWKQEGAPDDPVPVSVDLAAAFDKSKPNKD